ncbi:MAG: uroporphyrinogen decarboxylase family protein [Phycisphaerae bacterium]
MSRNDIVRAVGGTIWSRVHSVQVYNDLPKERRELGDGRWVDVVHTPKGDLSYLYVTQGGADRAVVLHEHPVKSVADLPALRELMSATKFTVDAARAKEELAAVGEDGIVLEPCPCVPFIQFGKMEAGWELGLLMWYDHRAEVEKTLEAIEAVHLEEIRLTAVNSPAPVVHLGDNMDQLMMSPDLFRRYALPSYAKAAKIVHGAGKLLSVHWCGRTTVLLPLLPGSGVDVVEAVVTTPMSDLTIERALASLRGQVVLQGCLPAVLMCEADGTRDDLARYVRHIVDDVHPTRLSTTTM